MPVAMERALERVADKKGLTGKERDAFIYGSMRNIGWKPEREVDKSTKNMSTRIDRLVTLNAKTDRLMQFERRVLPTGEVIDDEPISTTPAIPVPVAGLAGAGAVLGHQAIQRGGGYGAVSSLAGRKTVAGVGAGRVAAGRVGQAGGGVLQKILRALSSGGKAARYAMASRHDKIVQLNSMADNLLTFDTPLGEFNKAHRAILDERKGSFQKIRTENKAIIRDARIAIRRSRDAIEETNWGIDPAVHPLQDKLHRESYVRRGAGIGALAGIATGVTAGVKASRRTKGLGGALGGILGATIGASAGVEIGGRIRRKTPIQNS